MLLTKRTTVARNVIAWMCITLSATAGAQSSWYVPVKSHFRTEYFRNPENPKLQTWDDYWGWIQKFYGGMFIVWEGWTNLGQRCLLRVAPNARKKLIPEWNALGIRISQEWAKDNSLRKIDRDTLMKWANEDLKTAVSEDSGDGKRIDGCLRRIDGLVTKRLKN
jgi:hypothetical protein